MNLDHTDLIHFSLTFNVSYVRLCGMANHLFFDNTLAIGRYNEAVSVVDV